MSSEFELWTIECIKDHKNKIIRERLKDAKDVCGIVDFPSWDFIQPLHFFPPQLHVEIELVNNALESFYNFVKEQAEVAPPEELMPWNSMILSDVAVAKAKERLDQWKETCCTDLATHRYSKSQLSKALKSRRISAAEHQSLLLQQQELDGSIQALVQQRKTLESDIGVKRKRKALTAAKAAFKEIRAKKKLKLQF